MAILELAPEDGEHIGPYRIVRLLGRGGMGEVFLAWDPDLQRSVAIKRIRPDSELGPTLRQRLLREAQTAGSLHHPSIVVVYHLLKYANDDCIVMEYVQGQTLAEALRDGPLELARAVGLAKEVAAGLAVAHAAGIIHRDLKAENVMITPAQAAKILDFGLAKPMGIKAVDPALTATGHVVGTRRSMSPEQLRGAEVDGRSDLFSLGVLLYEMLTGSSPFQGVKAPAILCQMFRSGAPPRLVALLERLLAQEPAARFQTAGEVVRELEAIAASLSPPEGLDGEETLSALPTEAMGRLGGGSHLPSTPPQPAPTPVPEALSQPGRRRRLVTAISLSLLVLVSAVFVYQRYASRNRVKLLRIVVPRPEVGDNPQLQLAASGLLNVSLDTLGSLQGIVAVDPLEIKGSLKTPKELALAAGADEVLVISLAKEGPGNLGRIILRYIRARDGKILGTDNFQDSLDPQELLSLSKHLDRQLRNHFFNHPPMIGLLPLEVKKEDYTSFLDIQQRIQKGQTSLEPELGRLEALIDRSPEFLEARLQAADVAISLFKSKHDPHFSKLAHSFLKRAEPSTPDPRFLRTQFELELAEGTPQKAAQSLAQLENLRPDGPQDMLLRANLATAQGDLKTALTYQAEATDSVPSWTNFLELAGIEEKLGMVPDAKRDLTRILQESPNNIIGWERLAELELDFGDPREAEKIYRKLIAHSTERAANLRLRANLGAALILQQRYTDAVAELNRSTNIDRDDIGINLNLADAEDGLGHKDVAHGLYEKVYEKLKADHQGSTDISSAVAETQCLAHLRPAENAGETATNILSQNPDDITLLPFVAQVFALTHDPRAKVYIQDSIKAGIQRCWFKLPAYRSLLEDPDLKEQLGEVRCGDAIGKLAR